jgi:hypothetical protein
LEDQGKRAVIMAWLIDHYTGVARALAWIGIWAIIILSVVPAADRPVTGAGQWLGHFTAFAIVSGAFAIGYRFSFTWLLFLAVFFCVWNRSTSNSPSNQTCPSE